LSPNERARPEKVSLKKILYLKKTKMDKFEIMLRYKKPFRKLALFSFAISFARKKSIVVDMKIKNR